MSWKKVLKRLTFDANQLCCDVLRQELSDFMEKYRKAPTFALSRIGQMSCKTLENYFHHILTRTKFTPEEDKAFTKVIEAREKCYEENTALFENFDRLFRKGGDNFKREKSEGLHGWFSRRGGKESKGGKTQGGWIACGTCGDKGGPKPCGRADASKGTKRRCRPTCAACKTYKRRKGSP
jgi:hypothetical protein